MDTLAAQFESLTTSSPTSHDDNLITDDSRVYVHYDLDEPPAKPQGFTRFICISDTHGSTPRVPPGDILIHAGDISVYGKRKTFETSATWLRALPHPVKLLIAGNHDRTLDPELCFDDSDKKTMKRTLDLFTNTTSTSSGIRYLQYASTSVSNDPSPPWRAFGSPSWFGGAFSPRLIETEQGTPLYNAGAFQYYEEDADDVNALVPLDTQILITHGPPEGILDSSRRGTHAGCPSLTQRLFAPTNPSPPSPNAKTKSKAKSKSEREMPWLPHVRLHVFGHIHEGWGTQIVRRAPPDSEGGDRNRAGSEIETVFVNAAVQRPGSRPVIVDLRNPPRAEEISSMRNGICDDESAEKRL